MKRITTEFSKNIRASLRINSSSPSSIDDDGSVQCDIASSPSLQSAPQRQSSLGEFADSGPLPPLPFQGRNRKPSILVVTPAHLRRPGPHSPGFHLPVLSTEDQLNSLYRNLVEDGTPKMLRGKEKKAEITDCEIKVAVRVRPKIAPARWPTRLPADSGRPCVLIEKPVATGNGSRATVGQEVVSARQQQTLALLEKLEKKSGESNDNGPEETDIKPKLFVTVPQFVQGAISTTSITRKFSSFDFVFDDAASQEDVYNGVSTLIDELLSEKEPGNSNANDANDLTLVTCGHAKSGKSYTLFGPMNDVSPVGGQRRPPPVPVKRGKARLSTHIQEIENLQPDDGLLQRVVARIISNSTGAVSMSYAQLMPATDLPWSLLSISSSPLRGTDHAIDLLTGEDKYEIKREDFWVSLAKAPVNSLQEVNQRLRDGRRYTSGYGSHIVVSFDFTVKGGSARRLVLVDAAFADALQATTPRSTFSSSRSTSSTGIFPLEALFGDLRFLAKRMLLIASVSQMSGDAEETLATLVSADELMSIHKANSRLRRKKQLSRRLEYASAPQRQDSAAHSKRQAPSEASSPIQAVQRLDDDQVINADVNDLHSQLHEERQANRTLCRKLEELAEDMSCAQQELVRAQLRERDLTLDVSATQGSLMALAQERDFEHAALLEAQTAAAALREKWSSALEQCKTLRQVISGLTADTSVGLDGRLVLRRTEKAKVDALGSVAEALATLSSRHAEMHTANEKLRRDLDEKDSQLRKLSRILVKERQIRVKLRVKLGDMNRDISSDDEEVESADEHSLNEFASRSASLKKRPQASGLAPRPSAVVKKTSVGKSASPKIDVSRDPSQIITKSSASKSVSPMVDVAQSSPLRLAFESQTKPPAINSASPKVEVSLTSPLQLMFESQLTEGITQLEIPKRDQTNAADEAEWEALVQKLDHDEGSNPSASKELDIDLPAELQSDAEWEAMIARFEQEERRRKPAIRHRIHIAKIADIG